MFLKSVGMFLARLRQSLFTLKTDHEIDDCIAAQLMGEKDHGYPFSTTDEMEAATEDMNVLATLSEIEGQIARMPKAYGKGFRYVMHRKLAKELALFSQLACRRAKPERIDPRLVARRA